MALQGQIGIIDNFHNALVDDGSKFVVFVGPIPAVGWVGEWDRKAHYLHHLDAIMSLQKSGKLGGQSSAREEYDKLLAEDQEALTNEWYEGHLRALRERRKKKK